jgi:hypothetical protein
MGLTASAEAYMTGAIESIDQAFGKGYAKKNPHLVATFMKVCAIDFKTAIRAGVVDR